LAQICAALYTNLCAGLPPPPNVLTCVSLYQDCSGFGGTSPQQNNTINLGGLTAPTPDAVQATADCQNAPTKSSRLNGSVIPGITQPQQCVLKTYLETDTAVGDAEFAYNQNVQQFKLEVDAQKAEILLKVLRTCKDVCPTLAPDKTQNLNKAYNALGYVVTATLGPDFDTIAAPGTPVSDTPPTISLARFCTVYADVGDQNSCRELETAINESLQSAADSLRARKHELGIDVPFTPPPTKSGHVAAAKRTATHPEVLFDGYAELRPGHAGTIRLRFPRRLRTALTKVLHHGAIHGVLVVQASMVEGITTMHRVTVRIALK
jgi:hypothetical protein